VRAAVFDGIEAVAVADMPEPRVEEPEDAVVRITVSAICGSDLHAYHGKFPLKPGESIGHEAVGVVQEVGPAVERFHPGDRVAIAFSNVCGACWYCRQGQTSLCERFRNLGFGEFGGGLGGLQAEAARVPFADVNLLGIPQEMDDERALFVGDILTTGWYGASLPGIRDGEAVAVVGAGPVGHFGAQAARALGAATVAVLDRVQDRLDLAERAGFVPVSVDQDDPKSAVRALTGGRGADVVVEAVGLPAAYRTALSMVRRGGRIVVVGVFGDESLDVNMGYYWNRGLHVLFAGICPVQAWWEESMSAVRDGRIDPSPIISHRLSLEEAPAGYAMFDRREATKVLLRP
jgi:threonine dehydrogenase-like Zn-dependent dehydrogenase